MDSLELQKRTAREGLEPILSSLMILTSPEQLSLRTEARLWTVLVADLLDGQFWLSIDKLVERGVVSGPVNGAEHSYLEHHAMWGSEVLRRVVIPVLIIGPK